MNSTTETAEELRQKVVDESIDSEPENCYKQKYIQPYGVEGLEDLEDYRENGLHPVDILDILDGRFEVCHKLGSGGIATVWLCYETARKRWRAIKINAASKSSENSAELKIAKVFENQDVTIQDLELHHIIVAGETFWIEGPNGKHLCSVLPVLGPSLPHWRHMSVGFDATRIKNVCYEITEGLHFIHEHGICHGDFRPQNILMRLTEGGLDHLDPDDLFGLISLHRRHKVCTLNGESSSRAPKWVVEPLRWFELKDLIQDSIAIVDFGEAFEVTSPPSFLGIPDTYASPEVAYGGAPWGKEIDVWSLALTIMETRTGVQLGETPNDPINRMEGFAGPIPPPYRSVAAEEMYRDEIRHFEAYGQEGEAQPQPLSEKMLESTMSLTELISMQSQGEVESLGERKVSSPDGIESELGRELWKSVLLSVEENVSGEQGAIKKVPYRIPKDELRILADLLRRMLKYKPSDRLAASSVLEHAWFKRVLGNEQFDRVNNHEQRLPSGSQGGLRTVDEKGNSLKPRMASEDPVCVGNGYPKPLFSITPSQCLFSLIILLPILISFIILWIYQRDT
ncbi:kinase-like domain-containing protein [Xylaria venustula]|nr:kinase-like domain-containing protein [Xylaria venustula]